MSSSGDNVSSAYDDEDLSLQSIDIPFDSPPRPSDACRSPLKPTHNNAKPPADEGKAAASNDDAPHATPSLHHAWQCTACECLHICDGEASYAPLLCGGEVEDGVEECESTAFKLCAAKLTDTGDGLQVEVWPVAREIVMKDRKVVEARELTQMESAEKDMMPLEREECDSADVDIPATLLAGDGCGAGSGGEGSCACRPLVDYANGDDFNDGDDPNYDHGKDDQVGFTVFTGDDQPYPPPSGRSYQQPESFYGRDKTNRMLPMPLKITLPMRVRRFSRREAEAPALERVDSVTDCADVLMQEEKGKGKAPVVRAGVRSALYDHNRVRRGEGGPRPVLHLKLDSRGRPYAVTSSPISHEDIVDPDTTCGEGYGAEYRVYHQTERSPMWQGVVVRNMHPNEPEADSPWRLICSDEGEVGTYDANGIYTGSFQDCSSLPSSSDVYYDPPELRNKRASKKLRQKMASVRGIRTKDQHFQAKHGKKVVFPAKRQASTEAGPSTSKRASLGFKTGNVEPGTVTPHAGPSTTTTCAQTEKPHCGESDMRARKLFSIAELLNSSSSPTDPAHPAAFDSCTRAGPATTTPCGQMEKPHKGESDLQARKLCSIAELLNSSSSPTDLAAFDSSARDLYLEQTHHLGEDRAQMIAATSIQSIDDSLPGPASAQKEQPALTGGQLQLDRIAAMAYDDKWTRVIPKVALENAITWLHELGRLIDSTVQGTPVWYSGELPRIIELVAVGNGDEYVMRRVHTGERTHRAQASADAHAGYVTQIQALKGKMSELEKQFYVLRRVPKQGQSEEWQLVNSAE